KDAAPARSTATTVSTTMPTQWARSMVMMSLSSTDSPPVGRGAPRLVPQRGPCYQMLASRTFRIGVRHPTSPDRRTIFTCPGRTREGLDRRILARDAPARTDREEREVERG